MKRPFSLAATPRALHSQPTETDLFCEKDYCLSWSFSIRGTLLLWHTSGGPLRFTPGTKARGRHLCAFPLSHSKFPVSPGKELAHPSGILTFVTVAWETPLDDQALLANETHTCSPTGLFMCIYRKLLSEILTDRPCHT